MRWCLSAVLILLGSATASAEVWIGREGSCGQLRARWDVQQQSNGVWVGWISARHVGGPCIQGTGEQVEFRVRAALQGDTLFAVRHAENGEICMYYADADARGLRGFRLCEGRNERPENFALSFPRGRSDQREEDEWVRDPRNYDRRYAPPSFQRP